MWEHWWCMESVQQDAISTCGHLECHHIRTCETAGRGRRHWNYFYKCRRRVCNQTLFILWGSWMHVSGMVTLEEVRCVHEQINESWLDSDVFVRIGLTFTCMQNVGALRILGECLIRCHLQMWSLGISCIGTCEVGNSRRHWNYFNKRNRNVYSQTLLLLWWCWMHVPAW
jgi:hypothetical protein